MDPAEWAAFRERIATVARMGAEEYGLTVGIHAHAAGFMDFEPELERLLDEVDEDILKICLRHRPPFLCRLRSGRVHAAPYRADFLHALQGHRPRREGSRHREPHRLLRGLRSGHLLQPRRGRRRFSGRPPGPCSTAASRAGAPSSRTATPRSTSTRWTDARANRAYLRVHRLHLRSAEMDQLNWGMIGGGEGSQIGPAHRTRRRARRRFRLRGGRARPPAGRWARAMGAGSASTRTAPMATGARCWRASGTGPTGSIS